MQSDSYKATNRVTKLPLIQGLNDHENERKRRSDGNRESNFSEFRFIGLEEPAPCRR